jgi:hypothetical protein
MAQLAPLNGMVVDDFNDDGNLDIAINGNDYGNEVLNGRYEAMNGLVLQGDGKGNFMPLTIVQSGLFISGDGKALIKLRSADSSYLLASSENRGPLKIFKRRSTDQKLILLQSPDRSFLITLANGKKRKGELYYGSSFMSQSSSFLEIGRSVLSVEIKDAAGKIHNINLQ